MKTLKASSPLALADYAAAALRKTPADSLVAIGMTGTRLGAVMRVDDVAPAGFLGTFLAQSLRDSGHERAILIGYGPADRALRWFEVDLMQDYGTVVARVRKQVYVRRKPARS